MIFIVVGIGYVLLLALLVRFFQAVHRWDEEIISIEMDGKMSSEQVPKPNTA
jgi:hypothetical protein